MPSSVAHGFAAVAVGTMLRVPTRARAAWYAGIASAVLLDLDAIGRLFGRGDVMWLGGHRALTHSLPFAVAAGAILTLLVYRQSPSVLSPRCLWAFLALAMASHGFLDALADYGEGIAFLAPFSDARWKFMWQPFDGLLPEILVIWVPGFFLTRWLLRARPGFEPGSATPAP